MPAQSASRVCSGGTISSPGCDCHSGPLWTIQVRRGLPVPASSELTSTLTRSAEPGIPCFQPGRFGSLRAPTGTALAPGLASGKNRPPRVSTGFLRSLSITAAAAAAVKPTAAPAASAVRAGRPLPPEDDPTIRRYGRAGRLSIQYRQIRRQLCNRIVTGQDTVSVPNHPARAARLWDYTCVPQHNGRFRPTGG